MEVTVQRTEVRHQPDPQQAVTACNIVITRAQKAKNTLVELPFYDAELQSKPSKQPKSKALRRREKLLATAKDHTGAMGGQGHRG